jgi:sulfur carrier protein ThiS
MSMHIILSPDQCLTQHASGRTIEQILLELGINPVNVLVSWNDTIIPENTRASDDMTIRLIRISHGG